MAAYDATLPEGCARTIYLCDDGKDPKKRKWVDSLAADVVYVSGRKRPAGMSSGSDLPCFVAVLCCSLVQLVHQQATWQPGWPSSCCAIQL